MKQAVYIILAVTQVLGAWLALAQTNHDSPPSQQRPATNSTASPVAVARTLSINPLVLLSSSSLDFGVVEVGSTNYLTLMVQNLGFGTLSGSARTLPPFSTSNSSYSLGRFQRHMLTVGYMPTVEGTNLQSVAIEGGSGAIVTVSGRGYRTPQRVRGLRSLAPAISAGTPPEARTE